MHRALLHTDERSEAPGTAYGTGHADRYPNPTVDAFAILRIAPEDSG